MNAKRLAAELGSNREKKNNLTKLISDHEQDVGDLEPNVKSQKVILEEKNKEFDQIEIKYRFAQDQIKSLEKSRWDAREEIMGERSSLDRSMSYIDVKSTVLKHLNVKRENFESDQTNLTLDQKKIDSEVDSCNSKVEKIKQEIESNQKSLEKKETEFSRFEMRIHSQKTERQSLRSQLSFFNELIEQRLSLIHI